jgi:micrococcal nuclease
MAMRGAYTRRGSLGLVVLALLAGLVVLRAASDDGEPADGGAMIEPRAATVLQVTDGDTVEVLVDGRREDVRYIGIDTPEVDPSIGVECFGRQASDLNQRLVGGQRVRLVFDDELRDRYGRLLAYVYVGRMLVNAEIVRRGYARTLTIPPNTDRAMLLGRLERAAGRTGRGLWSRCPA